MITCIDGLTGFPEAISAVYPKTEIQQCVIHQIRNSTKYVSYKDIKALIEKKKGSLVPIVVWEVTAADEKRLDAYEGYPNFYYKKEMKLPVRLANGKTKKLTAFIYIMHEERELGCPSLAYIRTCKEGYRNFGFDQKYLETAYLRSTKEEDS